MIDDKNNLKLNGKNEEDLKIISTYLQDSLVTVKNILFLKENKTFIMIVNRFMWEYAEREVHKRNRRIKCALRFEEVIKVKSKNIKQKNTNKSLEYLAINSNMVSNNHYVIKIFFSGGGIITIVSEVIEVFMSDLGKPWTVKHLPKHII